MRTFFALTSLVILLGASPGLASSTSSARQHFNLGRDLYRQARYLDAIAEFRAAYKAKPHPVIFFNLAQCYEKLGDTANALKNYREYLRQLPQAEDRGRVETVIQNLAIRLKEGAIQPLIINSSPPDATVLVDGEAVGSTPVKRETKAGTHLLEITLPDYLPLTREVETSAEHATQVDLMLQRNPDRPAAAEGAPSLAPRAAAAESTVPSSSSLTARVEPPPKPRVWTWVALGLGGGTAVAGTLFGISAKSEADQLTRPSNQTPYTSRTAADSVYNSSKSKAAIANGFFIASAVCVAAGTTLFFVEEKF
jgi:hypothetical protein